MADGLTDLGVALGNAPGGRRPSVGSESPTESFCKPASTATPRLRAHAAGDGSEGSLPRAPGPGDRHATSADPGDPAGAVPACPSPSPALRMFLGPPVPSRSLPSMLSALHTQRLEKGGVSTQKEGLGDLVILNLGSFKTEREKERMKYEPFHSRLF